MRIIVIGAGPIGGIIGGRLARAGNDVTLVEVDPEQVGAIREHGLYIEVPDGPFNIPVTILFPNEIEGKFDIAFIAVRSYQTKEVVDFLASHLTEKAILVSLQNGINPPALEDAVGPERAIGTVIRMGSQRVAPGRVRTSVRGKLYIGHLHGKPTSQLHTVHALLDAVIPTEMTDNISGILWSKLTYTCLGMFGSLADESLKTICEHEVNRRLCVDFLGEIVGVGKAAGARFVPLAEYDPLSFHPSLPLEARRAVLDEMARHWKSDDRKGPLRQFKRGDRPEVDQTVGYVLREGSKMGISTPLCEAVAGILHEIEAGKRQLGVQNYRDLTAAVG